MHAIAACTAVLPAVQRATSCVHNECFVLCTILYLCGILEDDTGLQ
jgi:hypothetical protein